MVKKSVNITRPASVSTDKSADINMKMRNVKTSPNVIRNFAQKDTQNIVKDFLKKDVVDSMKAVHIRTQTTTII